MKTKDKGDFALSQAIAYYMCQGYEVCLPVGDKRVWDLVVEKNGELSKVQVKYAGFYGKNQKCRAGLRITGGNQSYNYAKKYKDNDFDLLFICTARKEIYNIPWKEISARNEVTVDDKKYQKFRCS